MKAYFTEKCYADNRFMQKGVELQMDANSWYAAKRAYEYSCLLCCTRGVGAVDCSQCPIRGAMLTNSIVFRKKLTKEDKEWVERERKLL